LLRKRDEGKQHRWTRRNGCAGIGANPLVHLRRGGTSLVLDLGPESLPCVLHWGTDLEDGDLADLGLALRMPYVDSVVTAQSRVAVLPQHSAGWLGRPGCSVRGRAATGRSRSDQVEHRVDEAGSARWPDAPRERSGS